MSYRELDIAQVPLDGTTLIEASAGTGKTYAIANLFLRLVLEEELEVRRILVVTFTEAATKELRDRIRRNLSLARHTLGKPEACRDSTVARIMATVLASKSEERAAKLLRRAVISFDEASIFTIHGFCKRVLDENAFESGIMFDTELVTDQAALVQDITDDFWRRNFSDATPLRHAVATRKGLTYRRLTTLAGHLIAKPTLTLLPGTAAVSTAELTSRHTFLQAEWQAAAKRITAYLSTEKSGFGRTKNPFRKGALGRYLADLDNACSDQPTPAALGALEKFTPGHLTGCLKKGHRLVPHDFFDLCQAFGEAENDHIVWSKLSYADYLESELARRKQSLNVQSFDDLLATVHAALKYGETSPLARAVQNKFDAALIDEFQDTDPLQYDIFTKVFNPPNNRLFLIGDPKQSIYGFRGADVFAYIQAAENIADQQKYTLSENWRSTTGLVTATNHFFSQAANPFVLRDTIAYTPVQAAAESGGNQSPLKIDGESAQSLVLWFIRRDIADGKDKGPTKEQAREAAASAVVYEISRLLALAGRGRAVLGARALRPSDFAILVTRNADAELFKEQLGRLHIPAVITRTGNIFASDEARELELVLAAVLSPGNPFNLNTALATSLIGRSAGEILAYVEDESTFSDYEHHLERFAGYHDAWKSHGFIRMFRSWLADYDVRRTLLSRPYGERQLTNLLHLAELIHTAAVEHDLGMNGILNWMTEQSLSTEENTEQELRLERDDEAVQILTVFRSKGLEYPIVFCPFMWQTGATPRNDDVLFHAANQAYLYVGAGPLEQAHRNRAAAENLSELVRLLYVAITRAANRCYLTCGKIGKPAANSLDYILTGGSPAGDRAAVDLLATIKALGEENFYAAVQKYISPHNDLIRLAACRPGRPAPYLSTGNQEDPALTCRIFNPGRSLNADWKITSFSMLAAEGKPGTHRYPDRMLRADEFPTAAAPAERAAPDSFFAFPGGTKTGSCIHAIFENLDFAMVADDRTREMITRMLQRYGLAGTTAAQGEDKRTASVHRMLKRVVQAPLKTDRPEFQLGRIPASQRLPEIEFYYPLGRVTPGRLRQVFARCTDAKDLAAAAFNDRLERLEFRPVQGFMRGFIDLVIQYEEKYYLLDWKTNNLGHDYADYAPPQLAKNMAAAMYNLQYYIYTVGLHKYLEHRVADYTYDTHFGGVFYLFIRGIHPQHPGSGIFFDRPSADLVKALGNLFDR